MRNLTRREAIAGAAALTAALTIPGIEAKASDRRVFYVEVETERKKVLFTPSFSYYDEPKIFVEDNCQTYIHSRIDRWDTVEKTADNPYGWVITTAKVDSDRYREWMKEHPPKNGIPPHVTFGGAVVAGKADPTFKDRWEERTRAHLATGMLV